MFKFDPETKRFFGVFLVLALFAALPGMLIGYILSGMFFILALFSLYFFRDPKRKPHGDESVIVSPADGKVVFIGEHDDPAFGRFKRIGIFMNIFNVHVNRTPCSGVVELLEYVEGGYFHAANEKAFATNERQKIFMCTDYGVVQIHQIAGMIARRVVCRVKEGQKLERGERIGIIRFGSRVELLLPYDTAEITTEIGERVRCGASPVAKWK